MPFYIVPQDNASDIVYFDVPKGENYESVSEVTEHPVEKGVNVVDHIRELPFTCSLQGYVTNTPIQRDLFKGRGVVSIVDAEFPSFVPPIEATPGSLFRLAAAGIGAVGDLLFGAAIPPKLQVLLFDTPFNRIQEVQIQLTLIQMRKALCRLITDTVVYENMVITKWSLPRDEPQAATFSIDMKQIRIVSSAIVAAPVPAEPRGSPLVKKGAQATKPVTGKDAAKSFLAKGYDAIFGG